MKTKTVRICIVGAAGRMGQALIRCASRFPKLSFVGAVESDESAALGKDAGLAVGAEPAGVVISSNARESAEAADVIIEFSSPAATVEHAVLATEMGKGMVIGTTGLDPSQSAAIRKASETIPIVWSPNMSMGVNLLFNLVEKAAGVLSDYDIEIVETHHKHKKDAPSGTALRLVEAAASARGLDPESVVLHGRRGQGGERPTNQIGVHAIRAGDVVGDHTVILATDGERVELTHKASSRDCFAVGALRAAGWVCGRAPGLYNMRHVLRLDA